MFVPPNHYVYEIDVHCIKNGFFFLLYIFLNCSLSDPLYMDRKKICVYNKQNHYSWHSPGYEAHIMSMSACNGMT